MIDLDPTLFIPSPFNCFIPDISKYSILMKKDNFDKASNPLSVIEGQSLMVNDKG
jgi:hypothetical protein